MSEPLKPCPFCGSRSLRENFYHTGVVDKRLYFVRCGVCQAEVCGKDEEQAVTHWNARAGS